MATIRDVAKESGVSVTTVSVVMNNAPRPVNSETRQRVIAAARRLNYYPDVMARGLVSRRTRSIGVHFTNLDPAIITNYYAATLLSGIAAEGTTLKQDIHIFTTNWENAAVSGPHVKAQRTDGVLVIAPPIGSDIAAGLKAVGLPVVIVSAPSSIIDIPNVDIDNAHGARLATEHLLQLGHTRIAYMEAGRTHFSEEERNLSFQSVMKEAGLSVPEGYISGNSYVMAEVARSFHQLMALPSPPTAIFACNDLIASYILKVAWESGISIPEELSLVGFDDAPLASLSGPGLTTIQHPLQEVGAMAARILTERIEGRTVPERYIFPPELIVRGSTAPPKK